MKLSKQLLITAFVGALLTVPATAQVIYQDSFTGTAGTSLTGSAPTTANSLAGGSSSATWSAGAWSYTGTGSVSTTFDSDAVLPLAVQAGNIYTLSADLTPNATYTGAWLALGFVQSASSSGSYDPGWYNSSSAGPWLLSSTGTSPNAYEQAFGGTGTANQVDSAYTTSGTKSYVITLDTTGVNWTYSIAGAGFTGTTYTYTTNPTGIAGIAIAQSNGGYANPASGTIANLQLSVSTSAVPEPQTYVMLFAGLLSLILINRFRHSSGSQI